MSQDTIAVLISGVTFGVLILTWVWHIDRPIIWHNVRTAPNRWMARYLERRGWVVFCLDEDKRSCDHGCWMQLYETTKRYRS